MLLSDLSFSKHLRDTLLFLFGVSVVSQGCASLRTVRFVESVVGKCWEPNFSTRKLRLVFVLNGQNTLAISSQSLQSLLNRFSGSLMNEPTCSHHWGAISFATGIGYAAPKIRESRSGFSLYSTLDASRTSNTQPFVHIVMAWSGHTLRGASAAGFEAARRVLPPSIVRCSASTKQMSHDRPISITS